MWHPCVSWPGPEASPEAGGSPSPERRTCWWPAPRIGGAASIHRQGRRGRLAIAHHCRQSLLSLMGRSWPGCHRFSGARPADPPGPRIQRARPCGCSIRGAAPPAAHPPAVAGFGQGQIGQGFEGGGVCHCRQSVLSVTGRLGRSDHGRHIFGLRRCRRHCRQWLMILSSTHPGKLSGWKHPPKPLDL
jgi:hypothetical protein